MAVQTHAPAPAPAHGRLRFALSVIIGLSLGGVLAFVVGGALVGAEAGSMETTVNGWSTQRQCGQPGDDMLVQAACARDWTAANLPAEAVYWATTVDGTGEALSGQYNYVLHFPPGGLPPNEAFWSLTMTDAQKRLVANAANRYAVGDRSGLAQNADGSVDIYIQTASPAGHEANWLPAPEGDFMLWLRAYQPGAAILNGAYQPPAVTKDVGAATITAESEPAASPGRIPWFRILLVVGVAVLVVVLVILRRRQTPHTEHRARLRRRTVITVWAVAVLTAVIGTAAFIRVYPSLIYGVWRQAMVTHGVDAGSSSGIPVNTLYAVPELASPLASNSALLTTGANVDTLYVGGWLDLSKGPQVLHVPDTAGRYYSVELVDPQDGTAFAYVGRRTTGTAAGDFLITGPGWKGPVPAGMTQVSSPDSSAFVAGRVLVDGPSDLASAYDLSKQIRLTALDRWPSEQQGRAGAEPAAL